MKIVIDTLGGDNAPQAIVEGANLALKKNEDIEIVFTGNKTDILKFLNKEFENRTTIVETTQEVYNSDIPTAVFKEKPDSSLAVAFDILKENKADALISAGSTGAILVGGFTKIGRIKGVSRPALAPLLPTQTGGKVLLLDVGANMDAKSTNLYDFALMGASYMSLVFGIKQPKVALLNVGDEEEKGNELTKETFSLLKQEPKINFVGNIEARYIMSGKYDIVVADGFAGNVALKAIEGAVSLAVKEIKQTFKGVKGVLAGLFVNRRLKRFKAKLDYNKYGGSPFLGMKKIIIKSHGSSKAETIKNAIFQVYDLFKTNYIEKIEDEIAQKKLNANQ